MKIAFVFTGQGVQEVGMGKDLFDAFPDNRTLFQSIDKITNKEIIDICFNGPYNTLIDAHIAGIVVVGLASFINEILNDYDIYPDVCAGYSVGEYTALYVAGVLTFNDVISLVDQRGLCLKNAANNSNSGMFGVIGLNEVEIKKVITQIGKCYIANYNSPGNLTISYDNEVKEDLYDELIKAEAIKVVDIPVEAGWHSPFVESAAVEMKPYLDSVSYNKPKILVFDNYTAEPIKDHNKLSEILYYQVYHPVKWYQSVQSMIDIGVDTFIEVGFGNQLSKFIKYTNRKVNVFSTGSMPEIEKTIKHLKYAKTNNMIRAYK